MFGGQHHVLRARVVEDSGPGVRVPLLNFLIEDRSEIVVIVTCSIMFAMVCLGCRPLDAQSVEIPLSIGIVLDVILTGEVVVGMDERRPPWYRVKSPVNEYSELGVGIPSRKWMTIQRLKSRFVVRGSGRQHRHMRLPTSTLHQACKAGQIANSAFLFSCWQPLSTREPL